MCIRDSRRAADSAAARRQHRAPAPRCRCTRRTGRTARGSTRRTGRSGAATPRRGLRCLPPRRTRSPAPPPHRLPVPPTAR
eukprot:6715292-Prymnesium_polylepis.2